MIILPIHLKYKNRQITEHQLHPQEAYNYRVNLATLFKTAQQSALIFLLAVVTVSAPIQNEDHTAQRWVCRNSARRSKNYAHWLL